MTRFPFAFLFAVPVALVASAVAGCSSSSNPVGAGDSGEHTEGGGGGKTEGGKKTEAGGGGSDAGGDTGKTTNKDSGTKDTGVGPGIDAGPDAEPAGPTPVGTQILSGITEILGITDDGYMIYFNNSGLNALDYLTTGAKPISILAANDAAASPDVGLNHNIVFTISGFNAHNVGALSIWSHAHPTLTQISTASTGLTNVSADSSSIVYTTASNADGTIGSIAGANGDGSSPVVLETNVDLNSATGTTCPPVAQFDQHFAVVQYCPILDGGATGPSSITSFDTSNAWASMLLQSNALPTTNFYRFTLDDAGTNALTLGQTKHDGGLVSEQLSIVGLSAGATSAVTLTPNAGAPPATPAPGGTPIAYLSGGSQFALFSVFNNGLTEATFADPSAPVAVDHQIVAPADGGMAATSVGGIASVSPDSKWAITYGPVIDNALMLPVNLYLQSLTQSGGAFPAAQQISTGAAVFILGFSVDGTYAIFSSDLQSNGIQAPSLDQGSVGTLKSVNLATGATVVTVNGAQTVWNATGTHGTTVVYNWNYQSYDQGGGINGSAYADLWSADVSKASTGTLIVASADSSYYLSPDKTKLIYSFTHNAMSDGVYITNAP